MCFLPYLVLSDINIATLAFSWVYLRGRLLAIFLLPAFMHHYVSDMSYKEHLTGLSLIQPASLCHFKMECLVLYSLGLTVLSSSFYWPPSGLFLISTIYFSLNSLKVYRLFNSFSCYHENYNMHIFL